jgi:chromosome segregation ATPase
MSASFNFKSLAVALVEKLQSPAAADVPWIGPVPAAERNEIYLSMVAAAVKEDASELLNIVAGLLGKQKERAEAAEGRAAVAEYELASLRADASDLSERASTEIASLRSQLRTTNTELAEMRHLAELDAADEDALRSELSNVRTLLAEKLKELSAAQAAVLATAQVVEHIQRAREALKAESTALKAERDALKAESTALKAERDALKAERDALKADLEDEQRRVAEWECAYAQEAAAGDDDEEDTAPVGSEECGYLSDHGWGGADV